MSLALLGGGETSPWIDRIWIATDGSDDTGDGSEGNPLLNLNTAINWASAGNIIMVKGGTYTPASLLNVYKSDLTIMAVWGARPVFDATNYPTDGEGGFNDRVMRLQGVDNVTLQGFDLTNGPDGGLQIIGTCSGIRVNAVNAYQNGRTSLYEGEGFVADGAISDLWYTNCDSYENFDELGDVGLNADGFKISTTGTGCGYTYCRAWRNSDDGFDCYNSSQSSSVTVEPVTYEHCWSFENGILAGGSDSAGDGNGFKLGGQRTGLGNGSGGNTLLNSLAWGNREVGITDNSCTVANTVTYNTGYNNQRINIEGGSLAHTIQANVALVAGESNISIADTTNVSGNSWQLVGASTSDFVSTDDTTARGSRDADGNMPVSDFLRPVSGSVIDGIGGVPT